MMQIGDQHRCQCKHCGKELFPAQITIFPAPTPPACDHEWAGLSVWSSTSGDHGSRRCMKCGCYQQW